MAVLKLAGPQASASDLTLVRERLRESIDVKRSLLQEPGCLEATATAASWIVGSLRHGGKVIFFGNGGSAMDAGHLAAELTGRFAYDRPGLAALCLSDSTAGMTAIANDYGYDQVFSRQVQALGRPGDVVVGLTTSGMSANVVSALYGARRGEMSTVALCGRGGGRVADAADICIRVPSDDTARIQEACLHLGHSICEMVEAAMFPRPS